MIPLTPIAAVVLGVAVIANALSPLSKTPWIVVGIVLIVAGLVDTALRGTRAP